MYFGMLWYLCSSKLETDGLFTVLAEGRKTFVYSHLHPTGRVYEPHPKPVGVAFGGSIGNERIFMDEDFARVTIRHHAVDKTYHMVPFSPNQGFLPVEASVLEVEAWGLGGRTAREIQASYKKREDLFTEQRRKVSKSFQPALLELHALLQGDRPTGHFSPASRKLSAQSRDILTLFENQGADCWAGVENGVEGFLDALTKVTVILGGKSSVRRLTWTWQLGFDSLALRALHCAKNSMHEANLGSSALNSILTFDRNFNIICN
ncbi:hypothetical protein Salat_0622600 [Sesamum alatum]|uniref:TLDc domain-containing protein n=1 Tax=Sesamum alatum TaxID=300844 RepID=A0AAE2CU65_9LAMI|nr:hypothetical protein Salat_0622600 [Sesamum alatum]